MFYNKNFMNKSFFTKLNSFIYSPYFLLFFSVLILFANVFGIELFIYSLSFLIMSYIILFCENTYPLMGMFIYFYFSPSTKNNPGLNDQSIFYLKNGFIYIITIVVLVIILLLIRFIFDVKNKKIKISMPKLSIGFGILGLAYLLGGIFYSEYTTKNIFFSILEIISISAYYFIFVFTIDWKKVPKEYFGWICLFGIILIYLEVLNIYFANNVISDGVINRGKIYTGWGHYNNISLPICMFIPGVVYLGTISKKPYFFTIIAFISTGLLFLVQSRTSIAVGIFIFYVSLFFMFFNVDKFNKIFSVCTGVLGLIILLSGLIFKLFFVDELVDSLIHFSENTGNGRIQIYARGLEYFSQNPIFGTGFYSCDVFRWGSGHDTLIPARWHNTYIQLLASCGIVGIIAYGFHRVQTMLITLKNPSKEKIFLYLGIISLILASFLDCHFFNIGPGLIYGLFLALIEKQDEINIESKKI